LLADPKVVLLDEPTAALGVSQTHDVLNLIRLLRSQGHGVLLISHNLDDIFNVADRITVLRLGQNAAEFTVGECSREAVVHAITGANLPNTRERTGI
jgi:ABC-type sugar transport system ATPase subunit